MENTQIPLATADPLERKVINNVLVDNSLYHIASEFINADTFWGLREQKTWRYISEDMEAGRSSDAMNVAMRLKADGYDFASTVAELMEIETSYDFEQDVKILAEYAFRRKMYSLRGLADLAQNPSSDIYELQKQGFELLNSLNDISGSENYISVGDRSITVLGQVRERMLGMAPPKGIKTGFSVIDDSCGLREGHLFVIAAESSQGKSSLALDISLNVARQGFPGLFFSMEMNATEMTERCLSQISGLSSYQISQGNVTQEQYELLLAANRQLESLPLHFDDTQKHTPEQVMQSIRKGVIKMGIRYAVVDYLQIFGQSGSARMNTNEFYGSITRRMKNLAEELQITIILVSQLSRDRMNPVPTLSRLRGSGEIEENANEVLFVYRPERLKDSNVTAYPEPYEQKEIQGTAMLILAKCRGGKCGRDIVKFDGTRTHFSQEVVGNKEDIPFPASQPRQSQIEF